MRQPFRLRVAQLDVAAADRADDDEPLASARDGDIQSAFAAFAIERAEVQFDLALLVASVADAEENDVALIALHRLKILDEKSFETIGLEESFKVRLLAQLAFDLILNGVHLREAEGDDAERLVRRRAEMIEHELGDDLGLARVVTLAAAIVNAVRHVLELDSE